MENFLCYFYSRNYRKCKQTAEVLDSPVWTDKYKNIYLHNWQGKNNKILYATQNCLLIFCTRMKGHAVNQLGANEGYVMQSKNYMHFLDLVEPLISKIDPPTCVLFTSLYLFFDLERKASLFYCGSTSHYCNVQWKLPCALLF